MARVEIGRDITAEKNRAEELIDEFFRKIAQNAVFYLQKTGEARRVLAGERSSLIEKEAAMRGINKRVLAAQIDALARATEEQELARVGIKQQIRAAQSKSQISEILNSIGIKV